MKTKIQKNEELKHAKTLLDKSQALIFTDFTKVTAENMRRFRRELAANGASYLVIKKRLLGILLKERGINADLKQFKVSVGTIFSEGGIDKVAGPAFQFISKLEVPEGGDKQMWVKHILAGQDLVAAAAAGATAGAGAFDGAKVVAIGKLPPRDVLLAQLLGVMAGPVRAFLYLLDEKAKQGQGSKQENGKVAS